MQNSPHLSKDVSEETVMRQNVFIEGSSNRKQSLQFWVVKSMLDHHTYIHPSHVHLYNIITLSDSLFSPAFIVSQLCMKYTLCTYNPEFLVALTQQLLIAFQQCFMSGYDGHNQTQDLSLLTRCTSGVTIVISGIDICLFLLHFIQFDSGTPCQSGIECHNPYFEMISQMVRGSWPDHQGS